MKVFVLDDLNSDFVENAINKMYVAARNCYSGEGPEKLLCMAANEIEEDRKIKLIRQVIESGHTSILEHVLITFAVEDISRSCSHQFVRHRLCTFSQTSQRYVNMSDKSFNYVMPPAIARTFSTDKDLAKEYDAIMSQLKDFYDKAVSQGIAPEDARYVFPNAACTNIVCSTNLRNLIHIMGLRCCSRAQWEIRAVFIELAKKLKPIFPFLADQFDANCEQLGYCPEGSKSCKRYPTLKEL